MRSNVLGSVVEEPAGIKKASLGPRVMTATLYSVSVVVALAAGTYVTAVLFGVMAGLAAAEFYAMQRREDRLPNELFGAFAAAIMPLAAALWGLSGTMSVMTALIAASLLWHTLIIRVRTADTAEAIFGAAYTGFLLSYLVLIRDLNSGLVLSLALVLSVWLSDVGAFFIGSLIGRHKMAPVISPKKSWEGFVAGLVACVAIWALVPLVWTLIPDVPGQAPPLWLAIVTGVGVGVASVIGDLAESRIKREAGVKDSGTSLPGHGGFLDRLDSLILACLVAYWILVWGGVS
ncbi:MAG: phosphatidate cytidylyltransferase [Coriobacteriia bacterium]|nr:phosphatidate cytidylyltransferase [Coriobacteriia bacterium]